MSTEVSIRPRGRRPSTTRLWVLVDQPVNVSLEPRSIGRWSTCQRVEESTGAGTNMRRLTGINSPTGTPLRVTMKDSPRSSPRMISPLSLRRVRWVITFAISSTTAHHFAASALGF